MFGAQIEWAKIGESKKQKLLVRVLMKALTESQFCYCSLILVFHSRGFSHKINHLHERSLGVVYQGNISSCEDLLKSRLLSKKGTFNHQLKNYLKLNNLSNYIMHDIFKKILQLEVTNRLASNFVNTNKFGLNLLRELASKVWKMIPLEMKCSWSVKTSKTKIRNWGPKDCYCYLLLLLLLLCKTNINNIGFVSEI